jgi:hypothetical protein
MDVPKLVKHIKFKNGREDKIWEVTVGDETGCIILSLNDENHASWIRSGTSLTMRNALIFMHENKYMRMAINRWGKIDFSEANHPFNPIRGNNRSLDEYKELTD